MTPIEEMLTYPHRDGMVSYLTHGFKGWRSAGPVDEATVEVSARHVARGVGRYWGADDRKAVSPNRPVVEQEEGERGEISCVAVGISKV